MVSFPDAFRLTVARQYDIKCRISRSEYWWTMLWLTFYSWAASFISLVLSLILDLSDEAFLGLYIVLCLPLIGIIIVVNIRRIHDLDMSGWWVILLLVPLLNCAVIGMCLVKGTPGPNRFGPDSLMPGVNDHLLRKKAAPASQPPYAQQLYQGQPQQYAPQQPVAPQQYAAPQQPVAPQPAPQQPVPDFESVDDSNQSDAPKS